MASKQLLNKRLYGRIRSALRKQWLMSEERRNVIRRARISRGVYNCEKCGKHLKAKELQIHHLIPVGRLIDWDSYINNLFCCESDLIALCRSCHLESHSKNN